MPRTRYTKAVRNRERRQFARQETELRRLQRDLQRPADIVATPLFVDPIKDRRRTRRNQTRRHKRPGLIQQ